MYHGNKKSESNTSSKNTHPSLHNIWSMNTIYLYSIRIQLYAIISNQSWECVNELPGVSVTFNHNMENVVALLSWLCTLLVCPIYQSVWKHTHPKSQCHGVNTPTHHADCHTNVIMNCGTSDVKWSKSSPLWRNTTLTTALYCIVLQDVMVKPMAHPQNHGKRRYANRCFPIEAFIQ